jgi:hypothetical protein
LANPQSQESAQSALVGEDGEIKQRPFAGLAKLMKK